MIIFKQPVFLHGVRVTLFCIQETIYRVAPKSESLSSRSRIEYLILTDNNLVFDLYFNLTNKSNLTACFNMIQYNFLIIR